MKLKKLIQVTLVVFAVTIYFCSADTIVKSVKEGILLCYNTVIPSLFIFMIISAFLSGFKGSDILSFPFIPFFRLLNINNRRIMTYCVLSIMGGFASGGYFLNRISNEFDCENNLKNILTLLTSNNSPAFIIIAVGTQMLKSTKTGILLYISVLLSCFSTAFIFSFIRPYLAHQTPVSQNECNADITQSIKNAVNGILNICGVVIFVYTTCKVIYLYSNSPAVSVAFSLISEVTTACSSICTNYGSNLYLICIAVTVFPVSAYFQMKNYDEKHNYSFKFLFFSKLIQIPLCISFLRILVNWFPVSSSVYANGDIQINMYWHSPRLSVNLLIMSVCFIIAFDKKTGVFTKLLK